MNICYIAFPCNPYNGSESKIGWNIPLENSKIKDNNIIVVTIRDMKNDIDDYIKHNGNVNIKFYYVDLPKIIKKMFKKVSTVKLQLYHKQMYKLMKKKVLKENQIDIVHQITPIEIRSIGNYGKLKNIKFIVGPVGGGEKIPKPLNKYAKGHYLIENLRKFVNVLYKYKYIITKKYKCIDYIMFANNETCDFLKNKCNNINDNVYLEFGLTQNEFNVGQKNNNDIFKILVAGRLAYRKGHELLFDALNTLPEELKYEVSIVGDGPNKNKLKKIINNSSKLKDKVHFLGKVDYINMIEQYNEADILIMPSIRETSGNVMLEAMAKKIPVIALRKFGAAVFLDESCSWMYDGETRDEIISNLSNCIIEAMSNPKIVIEKGEFAYKKANEYSFNNKIEYYNKIYKKVIKK